MARRVPPRAWERPNPLPAVPTKRAEIRHVHGRSWKPYEVHRSMDCVKMEGWGLITRHWSLEGAGRAADAWTKPKLKARLVKTITSETA